MSSFFFFLFLLSSSSSYAVVCTLVERVCGSVPQGAELWSQLDTRRRVWRRRMSLVLMAVIPILNKPTLSDVQAASKSCKESCKADSDRNNGDAPARLSRGAGRRARRSTSKGAEQ
eukprot:1119291-Prorocentrum_minimum.AAC.3